MLAAESKVILLAGQLSHNGDSSATFCSDRLATTMSNSERNSSEQAHTSCDEVAGAKRHETGGPGSQSHRAQYQSAGLTADATGKTPNGAVN